MTEYHLKKIQIEIVNLCNFKCPLCPSPIKDHVVRRKMSYEEYVKIMGPILPGLTEVTLFGTRGEPLLNRDLEKIVSYTKENTKDAEIGISTNASLLTPDRADGLMMAGLDKLVLGVDGLSQESLAHYRIGANYNTIIENIRRACEIKKEKGYHTEIVWQFIPMKKNEEEIKFLEEFAFNLGLDIVSFKLSRSVAESEEYQTKSEEFIPQIINQVDFSCPSGTDKLYIDPNGDVFPCCHSEGVESMKMGNAFETPVLELWNQQFMKDLRNSFEQQKPWDYCEKECRGICHKQRFNIKKKKYPKKNLKDHFTIS